jgi:hypothetical protein
MCLSLCVCMFMYACVCVCVCVCVLVCVDHYGSINASATMQLSSAYKVLPVHDKTLLGIKKRCQTARMT